MLGKPGEGGNGKAGGCPSGVGSLGLGLKGGWNWGKGSTTRNGARKVGRRGLGNQGGLGNWEQGKVSGNWAQARSSPKCKMSGGLEEEW